MNGIKHLAWGLAVSCMVVTAGRADEPAAPTEIEGVRVRGRVYMPPGDGNNTNWQIWHEFDGSTTIADGGIYPNGFVIYDVGRPMVIDQFGLLARSLSQGDWRSRAANHKWYGTNNKEDALTNGVANMTFLYTTGPASEITGAGAAYTNLYTSASAQPFRYYCCNSIKDTNLNVHFMFFGKEAQVHQNPVYALSSGTLGEAAVRSPIPFTGTLAHWPHETKPKIVVMVAPTEHEHDYAAWAADPEKHVFESEVAYNQGDAWTVNVSDLPRGRWYARAFAVDDERQIAAHTGVDFLTGTSPYYPDAYYPKGVSPNAFWTYDGSVSGWPDVGGNLVVFTLDNPDVEIVGFRYWPRNEATWYGRSLNGARLSVSDETGDMGEVTDYTAIAARSNLLHYAEKVPDVSWTTFPRLTDLDLYVNRDTVTYYIENQVTIPFRHPRYLKFSGVDMYNWREIEFLTFPRPAEPEATVGLDKISGDYVGLAGYLDYRGNAASDCSVYASCVKPGEPKSYRQVGSGWANETTWSGVVDGLEGLTDYELDVIVSNALAGVKVLSTTLTTTEVVVEPPQLALTGVTPNLDGTVTFDWKLTSYGTGGKSVDIYVKWGADAEHLGEGVRIAQGVATIGNGSVTTDVVPCGESLVFALYAVSDNDRTSEPTEPLPATTYGPSGFATVKQVRDGEKGVKITGEVAPGLGETFVYMTWGTSASDLSNWTLLGTYTKDTPSKAISSTQTFPSCGQAHVAIVLSNSWKGVSWLTSSPTNVYLFGTWLPAHIRTNNKSANAYRLRDGNASLFIEEGNSAPYTLDLGSPHKLAGAIYQVRTSGNNDKSWMETLSVWTSLDGVNYQQAWSNETGAVADFGAMVDVPFPENWPPARYVQFTRANAKNATLMAAEIMAVGTDLALTANVVNPNGTGTEPVANLPDDPNGLYFTGKLLDGGPADVYACAAPKDCGGDAAAWIAGGTSIKLGTYSAGETISGRLPGVPKGTKHVRLVAIGENGESAVSPEKRTVTVGTKLYPAEMYISYSATGISGLYDNWTGTTVDTGGANKPYFKIPDVSGYRLASARVWLRSGWIDRWINLQIYVTDDPTQLELTDYSPNPTRVVKTFETNPLSGWQTLVRAIDTVGTIRSSELYWDIPIGKLPPGATYLKLDVGDQNNNIREVEFRMIRTAGSALIVR